MSPAAYALMLSQSRTTRGIVMGDHVPIQSSIFCAVLLYSGLPQR